MEEYLRSPWTRKHALVTDITMSRAQEFAQSVRPSTDTETRGLGTTEITGSEHLSPQWSHQSVALRVQKDLTVGV